MKASKTKPTDINVETYLFTLNEKRRLEAQIIIELMQEISGVIPIMWGPSIIEFGSNHYKYDTGREGDMPGLGFSPRKSAITIYFYEGFDRYGAQLKRLGKHKTSLSCLYINKISDIDLGTLGEMLDISSKVNSGQLHKVVTVDEFVDQIPTVSKATFSELRELVRKELPNASEVISYGILGYKVDDKRARVFISGWKDHVSMYPVPKDNNLRAELAPYIKGKGTLWFPLDKPLPKSLIVKSIKALTN